MLKDITIGQYIARDSIIHALDARIKIMITTILIISLFTINTFTGFAFFSTFILVVILLSKISVKKILKGLKPILILVVFTLLIHIFLTNGGEVLWSWKFISIESEGVYTGFFMVSRILILILFTSMLTLTTSPLQLTDGIEYILSPLKKVGVPASELSMMMTIALRFIPTLLEEADKIMKAQQARGADFESGNLIQRAKSLIPLLVPLFISAFRRADDLALAMESRCYRGGDGRTRLHELEYSYYDFIALLLVIVFAVFVAFY